MLEGKRGGSLGPNVSVENNSFCIVDNLEFGANDGLEGVTYVLEAGSMTHITCVFNLVNTFIETPAYRFPEKQVR